jgi:hypothetical protein
MYVCACFTAADALRVAAAVADRLRDDATTSASAQLALGGPIAEDVADLVNATLLDVFAATLHHARLVSKGSTWLMSGSGVHVLERPVVDAWIAAHKLYRSIMSMYQAKSVMCFNDEVRRRRAARAAVASGAAGGRAAAPAATKAPAAASGASVAVAATGAGAGAGAASGGGAGATAGPAQGAPTVDAEAEEDPVTVDRVAVFLSVVTPLRARCHLLLEFAPCVSVGDKEDVALPMPSPGRTKALAREGSTDAVASSAQQKALSAVSMWLSVAGSHAPDASGASTDTLSVVEQTFRRVSSLLLFDGPTSAGVGATTGTDAAPRLVVVHPRRVYQCFLARRRTSLLRFVGLHASVALLRSSNMPSVQREVVAVIPGALGPGANRGVPPNIHSVLSVGGFLHRPVLTQAWSNLLARQVFVVGPMAAVILANACVCS